jgi:hypothetical protein
MDREVRMRSLTVDEVEAVAGGSFMQTVEDYTSFGATAGGFFGYVVSGTVAGASRGGVAGGAMGFAFGAGYGFGSWLYDTFCY